MILKRFENLVEEKIEFPLAEMTTNLLKAAQRKVFDCNC